MGVQYLAARRLELPPSTQAVTQFAARQDWAQAPAVASAAAIDLPAEGNTFLVTGTTQIDDINGGQAGAKIVIKFTAACPLGDTGSLVPKGGARTTAVGEVILFEAVDDGGLSWVELASSEVGGGSAVTGQVNWIQGADVESANDIAIPSDGNTFKVVLGVGGVLTINNFTGSTSLIGTFLAIIFDDAFTLSDTGNIVLKGGSRATVAGETIFFHIQDNGGGGINIVEIASTVDAAAGGGVGDNEITTVDGGMAGGDRASLGTVGADALDIQTGRSNTSRTATGARALAVGYNSLASGADSIGLGAGAVAGNLSGIAIGKNSNIQGDESIAIGVGAIGGGNAGPGIYNTRSVSVGYSADASGQSAVAVGDNAGAYSEHCIAIGRNAATAHSYSIAIGSGADVNGAGSGAIALGKGAVTQGTRQIAIGEAATFGAGSPGGDPLNGIVIGYSAYNGGGDGTIVIGKNANGGPAPAPGYVSVVIGSEATSGPSGGGIAIGYSSQADARGIAIGNNPAATGTASIGIGNDLSVTGANAIGLGTGGVAVAAADNIGIGRIARIVGTESIAIGLNAGSGRTTGGQGRAVAIGHNANAGHLSVAIGWSANAYSDNSLLRATAIGYNAKAPNGGLAIGASSYAKYGGTAVGGAYAKYGVAIGESSQVRCYGTNSVAIGGSSDVGDNSDNCFATNSGFVTNTDYGVSLGGWVNYGGGLTLSIGLFSAQAYGKGAIAIGGPCNRPGAMRLSGVAIVPYNSTLSALSVPNEPEKTAYNSGVPAVVRAGRIDMVGASSDPIRRTMAFPAFTSMFIDELGVLSKDVNSPSNTGQIQVHGHNREGTTTAVTASFNFGSNVAISVASEAGFSVGDWVMIHIGTLNQVQEEGPNIVAKVTAVGPGQITIDYAQESGNTNQFVSKLTTPGGDGNVLSATNINALTAARQRQILASDLVNSYELITFERASADTGTALEIFPYLRGQLMEFTEAWTYTS